MGRTGKALILVVLCVPAVARALPLGGVIHFSGVGGKNLPAFRVVRPSTLYWRAAGHTFQLSSSLSAGDIGSEAASGWTFLAAGRYQYTVGAKGSWSIRVTAGVVSPKRVASGYLGYSGSGSMELPPIAIKRTTKLIWTANQGGIFQLASPTRGSVTAQQKRAGSTRLTPGIYRYTVDATGPWTIKWKP